MVKPIISTPGTEDSSGSEGKFAYYETMNSAHRKTQEDALAWHLFEKNMFKRLSPLDIAKRLWTSYKILDQQIKDKTIAAGSTASTTVYDGQGNLITATLADASSFVVVYDKKGKVLGTTRLNSLTHNPSDPSEAERIKNLGGIVSGGRVWSMSSSLNISRALGDHGFTNEGKKLISSDAKLDITNINTLLADKKINQNNVGSIQVISTCDGFTDAAAGRKNSTKKQHEEFLAQALSSIEGGNPGKKSEADIAKHLVQYAKDNKSADNISVAVQTIHAIEQEKLLPLSLTDDDSSMMGVYDGHGGSEAAHYAANNIGEIFSQQCKLSASQYAKQELSVDNNQELFKADNESALKYGFVINKNLDLHEQLLQAINFAQIKYAAHYENHSEHARGKQGFFSVFRHGQYGQNRASEFNKSAKSLDSYDAVIQHLDGFLSASNTRYHRHSFSSYLLDELSGVLKQHQKNGVSPDNGRHYDPQTAWSAAEKQLDELNAINPQKQEKDEGAGDLKMLGN